MIELIVISAVAIVLVVLVKLYNFKEEEIHIPNQPSAPEEDDDGGGRPSKPEVLK